MRFQLVCYVGDQMSSGRRLLGLLVLWLVNRMSLLLSYFLMSSCVNKNVTHLLVSDVPSVDYISVDEYVSLEALAGEVPKFVIYLTLILFHWACESFPMCLLPHFEHRLWLPEGGSFFEVGGKWLPLIFWPCDRSFPHCSLQLPWLSFAWDFFFLYLCWGNSVLWCHSRLIWAAWGSPDTCLMCCTIAFELSSFFC